VELGGVERRLDLVDERVAPDGQVGEERFAGAALDDRTAGSRAGSLAGATQKERSLE
jgi:hypothetical protein